MTTTASDQTRNPDSERSTMSHVLYRIGHFAGRHPWRVIGAWLVIAAAIFMFNSSQGGQYDETFTLPGSESQRAADAIQERFPAQTLYSSNVIFHSEDGLTDPDTKAAVEQAVEQLRDGPHVIAVSSPYEPRGPTVGADGRTAFATVGFDVEKVDSTDLEAAEKAVQDLRDAGIQVEYDGGLGYADIPAGGNSELIGILMAIVILAIAFGSLVAMSMPIATALVAIVVGPRARRGGGVLLVDGVTLDELNERAIVDRVEASGGRLDAGAGSSLRVRLPSAPTTTTPAPAAPG